MEPHVKFVDEEQIWFCWTQASSQPANIKNQTQSGLLISLRAMFMKNDWKFNKKKSGKMHMWNVQALCVYEYTYIQISK